MQRTRAALTARQSLLAILLGACLVIVPGACTSAAQESDQDEAAGADNNAEKAAAEKEQLQELKLADGLLLFRVPARWEKQQPSVRIIEVELKVPAKDDDAADPGRLTIMQAGGSVEANIDRWYAQFRQPDGKSSKEAAKVQEKEVDGLKVHVVDLGGTFIDRPGPFAPATERENYRMLAAIIQTDGAGNYFVKLTGPATTIKQNEKAFARMVDELEWTD